MDNKNDKNTLQKKKKKKKSKKEKNYSISVIKNNIGATIL